MKVVLNSHPKLGKKKKKKKSCTVSVYTVQY